MEADYKLMPKRTNANSDGSSKKWSGAKFWTNYYQI